MPPHVCNSSTGNQKKKTTLSKKNGVRKKQPASKLLPRTRRHSSDYVMVFINYDVVYKNCVTIYIDHVVV